MDLISIIVPYYNQPAELQLAFDSINKQTYQNFEVIVVNDGSIIPPLPAFAKATAGTLGEGRVGSRLINQSNHGAPAARNRGLQESKGDYVIFWDADVVAEPAMLQKLFDALQNNLVASYAYCDYYFGWKKMLAGAFDLVHLRKLNYIHSTSLIRLSALQQTGIKWDESLKKFQDWDLWLSLAEQNKIGIYVPECLFKIIVNKKGMSAWLPSFAYKKPWRYLPGVRGLVKKYDEGKKVLFLKHGLI